MKLRGVNTRSLLRIALKRFHLMFVFHADEKPIQSMIDEYLENIPVENKSDSMLNLRESDFTAFGYVVYWIERDQFLTPIRENNACLFHELIAWAKRFERRDDATSIAMLLLQMGVTLNTGFKVFKLISNEVSVAATSEAQKNTANKKPEFTGADQSPQYVILLSPIWSNRPFDGGKQVEHVYESCLDD